MFWVHCFGSFSVNVLVNISRRPSWSATWVPVLGWPAGGGPFTAVPFPLWDHNTSQPTTPAMAAQTSHEIRESIVL